jgi:hypothetical protein
MSVRIPPLPVGKSRAFPGKTQRGVETSPQPRGRLEKFYRRPRSAGGGTPKSGRGAGSRSLSSYKVVPTRGLEERKQWRWITASYVRTSSS